MNELLRILVVEDDEVDRLAIRRYLAKTGLRLEMTEAVDAASARDQLADRRFDCIFLDYLLPDSDGISFVKSMRLEGVFIPILVLTGQGDEQIAVELMKAGASDYLAKSRLSSEILTRTVRNAIRVYRAEQQIRETQEQLRQTNEVLKQQNGELAAQRTQIERQNLQLLEASRLRSEFLATVTHELRTPLHSILGFSQILKSQVKGKLNEQQAEMVSRIFTNGNSLLNLVNDILDMSTIEANRLDLTPSLFDLQHLVQETVAELMPLVDKKQLNMNVSIDLEDSMIFNDQHRLKQVLVNLISNAVKFTDDGHVSVLVFAPTSDEIEIRVEDSGIGIAPDSLDTIFHPFRQADQTLQRRYPGSGLGLAITHSLISMMKGQISVESEIDRGTTFSVNLPRQISAAAFPFSSHPVVKGNTSSTRGRA